ncbi:MAG: hypothetical protein IJT20_05370 [Synergistaceae bacterium]|nr:hypothetical protein [Synergistaceae bacterium]
MKNKNFLRIFISFALVLFVCACAFAMAKDGHRRVWNESFGFAYQSSNSVESIWTTAQSVIDYYNQDYDILKKNFKWFKLDNAGHRMLFHWGFNIKPSNYEPLRRLVSDRLNKSNIKDKNREAKKFFATINEMDTRRKTKLLVTVGKTFDTVTYAPTITSIIYDLHIIADYTTNNVDGLPKFDDVQERLVQSIRQLAGNKPSEKLARLGNKFSIEVNSPESDVHMKAAKIIEASKNYLPAVMNERFGKNLNKRGIFIRNVY